MKIRDGTAGIAELITHFFFCISATAASLILRNSKLQKNLLHQTPRKFLLADLPCTHFAQSGFGDSPRAHTEIALLHRHRHSLLFSLPKRKILSNFHSVFFLPSIVVCATTIQRYPTKKSYTIFWGSNPHSSLHSTSPESRGIEVTSLESPGTHDSPPQRSVTSPAGSDQVRTHSSHAQDFIDFRNPPLWCPMELLHLCMVIPRT